MSIFNYYIDIEYSDYIDCDFHSGYDVYAVIYKGRIALDNIDVCLLSVL